MSTPIPSPSMNGTIGLSGAGCPGTIFAPPSGTRIEVVVLISNGNATVSRMEDAQRIAESLLEGFDRHYRLFRETSAQAKRRFDAGDWAASSAWSRSGSASTTSAYRVRRAPAPSSRSSALDDARPGRRRSSATSACSSTTSGPSSRRRSSTR